MNDGGHGLVVGHHGLEELAFDPIFIRVLAPMISERDRKFGYSPKELTRFFIFLHSKLIGFILHHFIIGALNAHTSPIETQHNATRLWPWRRVEDEGDLRGELPLG